MSGDRYKIAEPNGIYYLINYCGLDRCFYKEGIQVRCKRKKKLHPRYKRGRVRGK